MLDEGVCLARIFDLVDRNLRRSLCGRMVGSVGHDSGIFDRVKKRCVLDPSFKEAYWEDMAMFVRSVAGSRVVEKAQARAAY